MAHILVVDDDPDVLGTTSRALSREDHHVAVAESAEEALAYLQEKLPDLIVLDIVMPEMDGLELCRHLRARPEYTRMPILFLTARSETDDVVAGLDAGGDDYIVKPFKLTELSARVRALLRRYAPSQADSGDVLEIGGLKLDANTFQVAGDTGTVQLTATEFRLLYHMMSHPGQVQSTEGLLEAVWNYPSGSGDPNLVRAHIRNLRQKTELDSANPRHLLTIHGVGYVLSD